MEQKCKSGTTVRKLCFHIKYKGWKKREKNEARFFHPQWLVRIRVTSQHFKEGREKRRENGGRGGRNRRSQGKRAFLYLDFIYMFMEPERLILMCASTVSERLQLTHWFSFLLSFFNKRIKLTDKLCALHNILCGH